MIGKLGPYLPASSESSGRKVPTRLAIWIEDEVGKVFVIGAAKGARVDLVGEML